MSALGKFVSHQLQMSDEEKAQIFLNLKKMYFLKKFIMTIFAHSSQ